MGGQNGNKRVTGREGREMPGVSGRKSKREGMASSGGFVEVT